MTWPAAFGSALISAARSPTSSPWMGRWENTPSSKSPQRLPITCLGSKPAWNALFSEHGWRPSDVALFFHGTTVATNTVIEKKGAKTGLLTTAGFRDVLEVGRTERPPLDLYNLAMERPKPLVPRRLRLGVPERINHRGEVVEPLDAEAVREAIDRMLAMDIEALAIFLPQRLRQSRPRTPGKRNCPVPPTRPLCGRLLRGESPVQGI